MRLWLLVQNLEPHVVRFKSRTLSCKRSESKYWINDHRYICSCNFWFPRRINFYWTCDSVQKILNHSEKSSRLPSNREPCTIFIYNDSKQAEEQWNPSSPNRRCHLDWSLGRPDRFTLPNFVMVHIFTIWQRWADFRNLVHQNTDRFEGNTIKWCSSRHHLCQWCWYFLHFQASS